MQTISEKSYNHVITEVKATMQKLKSYLPNLNLSEDGIKEGKLTVNLKNIELVGKPDYFDDRILIDFKTSKIMQEGFHAQLAAYKWLIKRTYGWNVDAKVVLLGGKQIKEVELTDTELRQGIGEFKNNLRRAIFLKKQILEGVEVPCEVGFNCVFCRYRHICNGI